ncbi:ABC transporter ATP-binding protein [uncultured Tateyamaria sp.]|uniref:ABC transporter transmembrane domain-containing protein n=1 Tax=uncultured Tateyamaria sp. TaxID=455651 RepID=UPI0026376620|nr:ABC transporter ATP-binding protein [uncultured Tateyamaria sp.]
MTPLPSIATQDRVIDAVLIISCAIVQAIALAVGAFATRDAFMALHSQQSLPMQTVAELGAAGLVAALCHLFARRRAEALGQSYAIALRRTLYSQIARLPKARHEERRVGALSLRFVGDLAAARLWFGRGLPDVLSAIVVLPGAMWILFSLNPTLAGTGLVPLGVALAIMCITAWHLEQRHRKLRKRRANIAISMIERIAIAPELDLMGRTNKELRALDEKGAALKGDAVSRRGRTAGLQTLLKVGTALSGLLMLWLAGQNGLAPATAAACMSVLAIVALPLQDLAASWDRYCAWRIAREKAQRLLDEPTVKRRSKPKSEPISVTLEGQVDGQPVSFSAGAGKVTHLRGSYARLCARVIAGLDTHGAVDLRFGSQTRSPKISYIGDEHVGLQGSLRRSVTLGAPKRPTDGVIQQALAAFDLNEVLRAPDGLDQRLAENGRNLTAAQTLRLDLARAVLGRADVIIISSLRWAADPERDRLLDALRHLTRATVILAEPTNTCTATSY